MKLIIQIPCFNEEQTLPQVIKDLPEEIDGIDQIEYLVIDDGSSDNTVRVARDLGVHHILPLGTNRGLAFAFYSGINHCLENGADIVVNTDGDNQYQGKDIEKLVAPVLDHRADIVVGARPIKSHTEFSPVKKLLQLMGSWTIRIVSKTKVKDASSGFRALSARACRRIFIYSRFSYTMETLIQAGNSNLRVVSVDINVNPTTRKSRLFKNLFQHVTRSGVTIVKMFIMYRPGRFFSLIGTLFMFAALILGIRYLYLIFWMTEPDPERTYIPSLILVSILAFLGVISYFLAILGELIKTQRMLSEEIISEIKWKV
ncbi:MAG: glycosyltransferase family 2 protein [Bacteroidales bacterium]|nr:glycosyltransferase family 2 protein [Bacteroidales bacterium]